MKKVLALVLILALIPCIVIAEEENLYEGDISFMGFSFGATHADVKAEINKNTNHSWRVNFNAMGAEGSAVFTRSIVDAMEEQKKAWGDTEVSENKYTVSQTVYSGEEYNVAGYGIQQFKMYFAYPNDDNQVLRDVNASVFYAGQYTFDSNNYPVGNEMFGDLREKLISVYGTPYSEGETLDVLYGEPDLTFWKGFFGDSLTLEEYNRMRREDFAIQTNYVVWKSATNGGVIVLEYDPVFGKNIRLTYLWMEGDELLKTSIALETNIEEETPEQFGNGDTGGL